MSTNLERSSPTTTTPVSSGFERLVSEKMELRVGRFERLGIKLFNVANCFISLGQLGARFEYLVHSITNMEAEFSDSIPPVDEILVIPDLLLHEHLGKHPMVVGAPHIRFFASNPIFDHTNQLIGSVVLIDYQPRDLDDEERQSLSDLASMAEREMAFGALYQSQLEIIKQNRNLKRDSLIDPLLGTWNKSAIVRSLKLEMERCAKAMKPLALLIASVDQMEFLREVHGVAATDMILVKTVSRIRSCVRPFDALGRFGTDLLLVVLPGASHLVATAVGERIRASVMMHPENIDSVNAALTISAGTASTDIFPEAEPETLVSLAEKALLSARNAGNNCVVQATPVQPDMII
ncbi:MULTISPECIES: GGDEF domain-containing protein [Undibacterium]|uniref:diguanylate cyclase n=1 Tax=Undibacterium umbellatum TaxID=2762300 RepID=A0ABR6Z3Y0_9BURK|nr:MULTISPECIES: diguanylate cyclase [Undibacterium]MBC3906329.1 diguanylate cyclase [Undibacterium umbellatum]MDP1977934.1 diguanylate cyclase [Undibacterium sp.]